MRRFNYAREVAAAGAVNTSEATIGGTMDLARLRDISFFLKNTGSTALNVGTISSSPDGTLWIDEDTSTFGTLGAGATAKVDIANNGRKLWRLRAKVGSSTTTLAFHVTGGD